MTLSGPTGSTAGAAGAGATGTGAGAAGAKAVMRAEMRAVRRSLSAADRATASASITSAVVALDLVADAVAVHLYLATPVEVNTLAIAATLLLEGRRVVIPVGDGVPESVGAYELAIEDLDALVVGERGLLMPPELRPVPPGWWDVVLVPLVAFDGSLRRLGQGGGYYDRLLFRTPRPALGLAFAAQQVAEVPVEPHDQPLDVIVTEDATFRAAAPV
jgi:5-formyltetrahydrofolate cyclo-ligase